ncbi:hypothetical protein EMPS_03326 [Entomortierella parvispora]|uniref:LysM domain-containing protein n=1 Tax=Entomortierella parvispora TaxID=205924 RepID=A0A9P3LUB2_9FUNG|nr:hypothetical protein EMPS_03326 [Entomortierella parvispora]
MGASPPHETASTSPSSSSSSTSSFSSDTTLHPSTLHSANTDPLSPPTLGADFTSTSSSSSSSLAQQPAKNSPSMLKVQHQTNALGRSPLTKGPSAAAASVRTTVEASKDFHPLAKGSIPGESDSRRSVDNTSSMDHDSSEKECEQDQDHKQTWRTRDGHGNGDYLQNNNMSLEKQLGGDPLASARSAEDTTTNDHRSSTGSDHSTDNPSPTADQASRPRVTLEPLSRSRQRTLSVPSANRLDYGQVRADIEPRSVTAETAVETQGRQTLDPLLPSLASHPRRRPSAGLVTSPTVLKQHPVLEHLNDMGPLELERGIDSGVHWNHDPIPVIKASSLPPTSKDSRPPTSESSTRSQRTVHHTYSSSTLASEGSTSSSQQSTGETLLKTERLGDDHSGSTWDGDHPLLLDYTMEPELLDEYEDSNFLNGEVHSQPLNDRTVSLRHKGHSMSMDAPREASPTAGSSFHASGPTTTRRRRNISRSKEQQGNGQDQDVQGHTRTMTESAGKRVIIHQVAINDTLAGIALYYGIQVPLLKKSNKLWTNDSIHTRKYLYIPFEDCSVARQAGVLVDERSQSVLLPQRRQTSQNRTGSTGQASSFTASRMSTYDAAINNSSLPANHGGNHFSTYRSNFDPSAPLSESPEISAVTAGMLPTSTPSTSISPRLGTWSDSKSVAAPPMPTSPTITSFQRKSDNNFSTMTPLLPSASGKVPAKDGFAFSGSLPDTVIVPPSMTHEALAARFKEMDMATGEQQRKSQSAQEQELRTNPIHHRHRTSDLRQYAHMQKQQQQQRQTRPADDGSVTSSNTSSRRTSVESSGIRELVMSAKAGVGSNIRGSSFRPTSETEIDPESVIKEEGEENPNVYDESPSVVLSPERLDSTTTPFVTFGHHQHIYQTYDPGSTSGSSRHGLEGSTSSSASSGEAPEHPRRQELITVPEGMLSFFPSPEHSKRLETPQSISKLQNQMDFYQTSPSSTISSGSSNNPNSRRGTRPSSKTGVNGARSKSRSSLGNQTFEAPSGQPVSSTTTYGRQPDSTSSTTSKPSNSATTSTSKSAYSKSVRLNSGSNQYSAQKWSLMGESLVDDLLGAVRGPLQIARRMYNLSSFGFGGASTNTSASASGKEGFTDSSPWRASGGGSIRRSRSGRGNRNSIGYAIELDQAKTTLVQGSTATSSDAAGTGRTLLRRMPTNESSTVPGGMTRPGRGSMRRKSSSGSSHGPRQGSTGSGESIGNSSSVRKRSLRSSHPINHGALMALVNELDKDKKEKEKEKERRESSGSHGSSGEVTADILA